MKDGRRPLWSAIEPQTEGAALLIQSRLGLRLRDELTKALKDLIHRHRYIDVFHRLVERRGHGWHGRVVYCSRQWTTFCGKSSVLENHE